VISFLSLSFLLSAAALPKECQTPELRDVSALTDLAKKSGSLSVGLDSIATWCFDGESRWTGGKVSKKAPNEKEPPQGDCLRSVSACVAAKSAISESMATLLNEALGDLNRPYLGATYTPKRSGLNERPNDFSDCSARVRTELFQWAQSRMDIARLAGQVQSEYGG
jgi:hypothetical protein